MSRNDPEDQPTGGFYSFLSVHPLKQWQGPNLHGYILTHNFLLCGVVVLPCIALGMPMR